MGELIPWIQVTISGFVYIAAVFFLLLRFVKKDDLIFKSIKEYLPYLAILTVFISYAVGYSAHLTAELILYKLNPEFEPTGEKMTALIYLKENRVEIYQSINNTYSNLVMFRHLFFASLFLGLSLTIWLWTHDNKRLRWISPITCTIFAVVFLVAWRMLSKNLSILKEIFL